MGFVIKTSRTAIDALHTQEQLICYIRFLERLLARRGVKYPAARFEKPDFSGMTRRDHLRAAAPRSPGEEPTK